MGETVRIEVDVSDLLARLMSEIEDVVALIARPPLAVLAEAAVASAPDLAKAA